MISPFFYMQKQKATEDERIAFYQERMAEVKDWLIHDFVRTCPGRYSYANLEGEILFWKLIVTDDHRVFINRNWWNRSVEWFCQEHHCKLEEIDLLYIIMQLYRSMGYDVKPVDGSLCITLFEPRN